MRRNARKCVQVGTGTVLDWCLMQHHSQGSRALCVVRGSGWGREEGRAQGRRVRGGRCG